MTTLPTWWAAVTLACFILTTVAVIGVMGGLLMMMGRSRKLLVDFSSRGLPQLYLISDQVKAITEKADHIARRIDEESSAALPRVESVLDRVDHTLQMVETRTERVNQGIDRVAHSPVTKPVLVGAGALAAARLIQSTVSHYRHRNGDRPH